MRQRLGSALSLALALTVTAGVAQADAPTVLAGKLDRGLQSFYSGDFAKSVSQLYEVYRAMADDPKRDIAEFYLASSLTQLGFSQAAIEHHLDIVAAHRAPELVNRSLAALDQHTRRRELDEDRLIGQALFGSAFGDVPPTLVTFVDYYQALGELRRGFDDWSAKRLEVLTKSDDYYGWKGRYVLAVERLQQNNTDGAEALFRLIAESDKAPAEIRNDARIGIARIQYGQKKFAEAFATYSKIDSPLADQDVVLLEKAWNEVARGNERRALGMVVGLGAPVFRRVFAPERELIRAIALNKLCQFRLAHLAVLDFRARYRDVLDKIRERQPLLSDEVLRLAATYRNELQSVARERDLLKDERERLANFSDRGLRGYLDTLYQARIGRNQAMLDRGLANAVAKVADDLLRIEEQMNIIDYEIGVGIFKRSREQMSQEHTGNVIVPPSSEQVYYRFDDEYWSDELQDFAVLVEDRCVQ